MAAVNYKLIKNFFDKNELKIYQKYCYNKLDESKSYKIDPQSFSPSWYDDPLMNSLLDIKLPIVEKESNLKLFPTYSYWRMYTWGSFLKKHKDRPSCEISVTVHISGKSNNFPIFIDGEEIHTEPGDGVIYKGIEVPHWRGTLREDFQCQVFLHYVNQNGPNKDHAYDNLRING